MTKCRTTHHHACACREARFERMERALVTIRHLSTTSGRGYESDRSAITEMCNAALRHESVTDDDYRPLPGDEGQ